MNEQSSQNQNDEIDLGVLFEKLKSFFKSLLLGVVMVFQFFWKHKFRLLILLILGIGLQFLLITQIEKVYVNEFLVKTNFESTEYLYSKAKSINTKLKSEDTLFLKEVFGTDYERVKELEVVPVVDIYFLVNESEENKEIFELLLDEYGDISFLEEEINVNKYPSHKIRVYIKGKEDNADISKKLLSFLSDNTYYNNLREIALENYNEQLDQNKTIRAQIDSIIKDQREAGNIPKSESNSISFSGSQDLRELLSQKQGLLNKDLMLRNQLSSEDEVLKTIDSSFGVYDKDRNLNNFMIPLLLMLAYSLIFFFLYLKRCTYKFIHNN